MKKRIISLLLALVMVIAMVPTAFAAEPAGGLANFKAVNEYKDGQFSDVKESHWFVDNVATAYELNLMQGNANGTFNPNGGIKIIEAIVSACRLHSIYYTGSANFVQGNPWYKVYMDYAEDYGIITAGEYSNINAAATRAQFICILAKALPEEALPAINRISLGSIPDVPYNVSYADAVYKMYNAGILTGNDDYGTFAPGATITRAQAAAIITRMADASLRMEKVLSVKELQAPSRIVIYDVADAPWMKGAKEYYPGQKSLLDATVYSGQAHSGIVWTSSDPSVASVDQKGNLETYKPGEAVITATAYNGVKGTFKVSVPYAEAQLRYALTADGKGYEVVGCDADAYTVHIPTTYNGLPVVSIKEKAFVDCSNLRKFTVAADQAVFYEEAGVIFADLPEKTLVVFPPAYNSEAYYYAPADTVAVASYAFAGLCNKELMNITFSEGLLRIGDGIFAQNRNWNVRVCMPRSLTEIGSNIREGYYSNVEFTCYEDSAFHWYASENWLTYGFFMNMELDLVPSESATPESLAYEQLIPTNEKKVKHLDDYWSTLYSLPNGMVDVQVDLSQLETEHDGEIRMKLERQWQEIIPDVNGNTELAYSPHTGLYGAGRTEGEAILRGYDMEGNLIAMQYISGDFAFAFPGAYNLGVEGGKNTHITVIPTEPVYIATGGNYEIDLEQWQTLPDGNVFEYYIVEMSNPEHKFYAHSTQRIYYSVRDAATGKPASGFANEGRGVGYLVFYVVGSDPSVAQNLDGCFLSFGGMETVLDTPELECMFNKEFNDPKGLADTLSTVWGQVKQFMLGAYVPADADIGKITICGDGSQRASAGANGVIYTGPQDQLITYIHEMVHAVDFNVEASDRVSPAAWVEGRAEYISYQIAETHGYDYVHNHLEFDWSYMTEEDRADFFRYYYFCSDGLVEYDVGYHFLVYLNETYGEDVSAKIMANLAALTEWDKSFRGEENAALFKQCVEDATEVGVFQNFVRDVIEK